jgi:hypothetical protein
MGRTSHHSNQITSKMNEERDTHGGEEICTQDFNGETCRKETSWEP